LVWLLGVELLVVNPSFSRIGVSHCKSTTENLEALHLKTKTASVTNNDSDSLPPGRGVAAFFQATGFAGFAGQTKSRSGVRSGF